MRSARSAREHHDVYREPGPNRRRQKMPHGASLSRNQTMSHAMTRTTMVRMAVPSVESTPSISGPTAIPEGGSVRAAAPPASARGRTSLHADGLRIHVPMRKSTLRVEQHRSFERFHLKHAPILLVPMPLPLTIRVPAPNGLRSTSWCGQYSPHSVTQAMKHHCAQALA